MKNSAIDRVANLRRYLVRKAEGRTAIKTVKYLFAEQSLEKIPDMFFTLLKAVAIDDYIMSSVLDRIVEVLSQGLVASGSGCAWHIAQTERHNVVFVLTESSVEGFQPLIAFLHSDATESCNDTHFDVVLLALHPCHSPLDQRNRITALDSHPRTL